jgi:tetraprenyl-beta-curcumene synthase
VKEVTSPPRTPRRSELAALPLVAIRFWARVLPLVRIELRAWERAAARIPDAQLREQALATLGSERLSAAGAALFAATLPHHDPVLVRTLVAYQVICDYLDTLSEQPAGDPTANGVALHRALADAVSPGAPCEDWYRLHRSGDDGGYLAALVDTCRIGCAELPAYAHVRTAIRREAERNEVQGIKHGPPSRRIPELRRWAQSQTDAVGDASWFELASAGSSPLAALALLAAAGDPATRGATAEQTRRCYFPWIEALSTLLDSLADREQDAANGELSLVDQYPSAAVAAARLRELTARTLAGARALPHGERHVVLVVGMIALHLSDPSAWLPASRPVTRAVLDASLPTLTPLLLSVLRVWRRARTIGARTPAVAARYAAGCAPRPTGQLTPVPPSPQ